MLMRNILILAATQSAFGSPATPTAGSNAILARTAMPTPISAEYAERTLLKGTKGNFGVVVAGEHREIDLEVELAGAGAAGSAPKYAPLLKGSGFSETLSAGVSATYALVNSGEPYLTLYCYLDGVRFNLEDAKLTVSFALNAKGIPVMKFKGMGKYVAATDTAIPGGIDVSGFITPKTFSKANTPTFTLHTVAVVADQLTVDLGNLLKWRDMPNFQGCISTDRKPTAKVGFELTTVAAKNWPAIVLAGTGGALQMIHGTAAGNICQLDAPNLIGNADPTLRDGDGVAMLDTSWAVSPNSSAGLDELVLTVK